MKNIFSFLLICFLLSVSLFAQQGKYMGPPEEVRKKVEELEKIKLMEVLNLKEDVMLKFFSRRKEFLDKFHQLEVQKDQKIDDLKDAIDKENDQSLKKRIDEINSLEESLSKNRTEFINSLGDVLTNQQIAKVIVFERNFWHELRDMIMKHRKGKGVL
jgi:hypothetical protein